MKKQLTKKVRVIRDTRDSSKDLFLPKKEAEKLFRAGKLSIDVDNSTIDETVYIEG